MVRCDVRVGAAIGAAILVGCLAQPARGQTRDTGAIFGTVTDSQGALIPGANVMLVSVATGQPRTAQTNESGGYLYSLLPPGSYNIAVEHGGFRKFEQRGILVQANENVKVDVALEVGSVQEVITVEGLASQIETRVSTLKETVDQRRVVELPLNGRNPADLALLAPGVVAGAGNTGDTSSNYIPRGTKTLTINGSRGNNVRYTLDGGENMDDLRNYNLPFPFPDALLEFSVQTANMSAEHGNSSAGVVNVVTKSGTNNVHGSGFWFVRNTALNASNFFSRTQDQLKRNQTGFTLGGPFLRNKLFGFGGYQRLWIRTASGATRVQTLTAAERRGDFSATSIRIYDPEGGQLFPNNTIPQSRLSPAAVNLLKVSPLPDPDGFTRFTFATPENGSQYVGKLDYVHSVKHNFSFRYFENDQTNPYHSPADNIHAVRTQGGINSKNATLGHTWVLRPTVLVHSQITGNVIRGNAISDFPLSVRDFGINVYSPSNDIDISMTNSGASFNAAPKVGFNRAAEEILHDWTWTRGNHSFTWGLLLAWRQYNEDTIFHSSGQFLFDGTATGSGSSAGFDRADFMLGRFSFFTQNNGEFENRRQPLRNFYVGDTWRLTPRFTLSFGLRWEPYTFFTDLKDRIQTFDAGNYAAGVRSKKFLNAPRGLLYVGDARPGGGTYGKSLMDSDLNNLAPRIGFAWDPFGGGRTSIRGGYAIFYDVPALNSLNDANNVSPFSYSVELREGLMDDPYRGRQQLNVYPLTQFRPDTPYSDPLYTIVVDGKYVTTYTQNWTLTVEREVLKDMRLRLGYVGTGARKLKAEYDQNAPVYNPNLTLAQNRATINERRPFKGYEEISRWFFGVNSAYHAFQASLDKRYSNGFTLSASYTWSKTLDYISQNGFGGRNQVQNPFNFFFRRGLADQHRPHRFVSSFVWDLPSPLASSAHPAAKAVVNNWRFSGIVTLQSGRPFGINATGDPRAAGASPGGPRAYVDLIGSGYPVLDTGRSKGAKIEAYFDKARFQNPGANQFGTLGRNPLLGPGYANVDVSMVKGWKLPFLGEGGLVQYRFEAFNLFNRTNLALPNTGITNVNFGRILSTDGDPRILQMALRIEF